MKVLAINILCFAAFVAGKPQVTEYESQQQAANPPMMMQVALPPPLAGSGMASGASNAASSPMMPMPYKFDYAVKDDPSLLNFGHKASSDDGKSVTGTYYVLLPDGRMETVNYRADDKGYVADVSYQGVATYPVMQQQQQQQLQTGLSASMAMPPSSMPPPPPPQPMAPYS